MTQKERYSNIINWFIENNAPHQPELIYNDPFSLLVAVILSAQCTDKRVNMVTPSLIAAYPNAFAMSKASEETVFEYIKSVSYPNSKAHYLVEMSKQLVEQYNGVVPNSVDELTKLTGVGRKTANVVTAVCFNAPNMPVDTHVHRVSKRLGLVDENATLLQTELTLKANIKDELIPKAHHWLILHGRYICQARKPKCDECGLSKYCKKME